MWIQFVNLGFILIFMSIDFRHIPLLNEVGIFTGQYNRFNSAWYIKFGS